MHEILQRQRFFKNIDRAHTGCWLWQGASTGWSNYGKFCRTLAHRWAYEHFIGPIPAGHVIDHVCRNRRCVNPEHLEAVTYGENNRRAWEIRKANAV